METTSGKGSKQRRLRCSPFKSFLTTDQAIKVSEYEALGMIPDREVINERKMEHLTD